LEGKIIMNIKVIFEKNSQIDSMAYVNPMISIIVSESIHALSINDPKIGEGTGIVIGLSIDQAYEIEEHLIQNKDMTLYVKNAEEKIILYHYELEFKLEKERCH
jgi:hypothetical protein